jgi:hypothetical protein
MDHILKTREVNESDLRAECPYLPEEGEYETYLSSLADAIEQLECVEETNINGSSIEISVSRNTKFETLHRSVKPLIQGETFSKLRVTSFA